MERVQGRKGKNQPDGHVAEEDGGDQSDRDGDIVEAKLKEGSTDQSSKSKDDQHLISVHDPHPITISCHQ